MCEIHGHFRKRTRIKDSGKQDIMTSEQAEKTRIANGRISWRAPFH